MSAKVNCLSHTVTSRAINCLTQSFIKEHLIPRDISAGVSIRHLSRVRRTQFGDDGVPIRELLLCAKESIARQELTSLLWIHTDPALRPRLAVASKWPAYTRKQYESFSKIWPVKGNPEGKRSTYVVHCSL
jgi:hypothetical protein